MLVHSKARGFVWRGAFCYGAIPYALPCPRQLPSRTFVQISPNLPLYKGRFPEVRIQSFTPAAVAGGFALCRVFPLWAVPCGRLPLRTLCAGSRIGIRLRALTLWQARCAGCSHCGRCLAAGSLCGRGFSVSAPQAISYFRKRKLKNLKYSHIFRERKHIYFGI